MCLRQPVASQLTRVAPLALDNNNDNYHLLGIYHVPGRIHRALLGGPHLRLTITLVSSSYYLTDEKNGQ